MSDENKPDNSENIAPVEVVTPQTDPTQLPDDHPLVKAYKAERDKNKSLAEKARQFDELEEAKKTEQEKLLTRAEKAETELAQTQLNLLRAEVALEKGLSATMAKRLTGSTREELEADADELAKLLAPGAVPAVPSAQGQGQVGEHISSDGLGQLTQTQLQAMTPAEIVKAKQEGRLDKLLGKLA